MTGARAARTRGLTALLALLALAGCGEGGILDPEEGLPGLWVRYEVASASGTRVRTPADTLDIAPDESVRWSRQAIDCCGGPPLQLEYPLQIERRGAAIFLAFHPAPCATCQSATRDLRISAAIRTNQMAPFDILVVRRGSDRLELLPVDGEPREHYERARTRLRILF